MHATKVAYTYEILHTFNRIKFKAKLPFVYGSVFRDLPVALTRERTTWDNESVIKTTAKSGSSRNFALG